MLHLLLKGKDKDTVSVASADSLEGVVTDKKRMDSAMIASPRSSPHLLVATESMLKLEQEHGPSIPSSCGAQTEYFTVSHNAVNESDTMARFDDSKYRDEHQDDSTYNNLSCLEIKKPENFSDECGDLDLPKCKILTPLLDLNLQSGEATNIVDQQATSKLASDNNLGTGVLENSETGIDQQFGKSIQELTAMGLPVCSGKWIDLLAAPGSHDNKTCNASDNTMIEISSNTDAVLSPVSESSVEDFYSKYKPDYYSSPSEASPVDQEPSIQDVMEFSDSLDKNKNPQTSVPSAEITTKEHGLTLADSWTEFPAPGNVQSISITDKHIWCCDKNDSLCYSSLFGTSLTWNKVPRIGASQISVSPSGWLIWRLHKGSVFAATNVTPRAPYGTKWMEIARNVAYISVDEHVAW